MRKKISIGFISLALILLFAGAVSMYELHRLRTQAMEVIEMNSYNTEIADRMFTALQTQNSSILRMIFSDSTVPDAGYELGLKAFDEALLAASATKSGTADLATVKDTYEDYQNVVSLHINNDETEDVDWFISSYLKAYYRLDEALKDYLTSPASSIPARAQMLEKNAYKTITPSILTLLVAIIIVLMFYFFVDSYYVRPITKIHKSLGNYLAHGVPFSPKFESNDDEVIGLRDMIEELTERKRNSSK